MQADCKMKKAGAEQSENPKWYFSFGQMKVPSIMRAVAGDPKLEPVYKNAVLEGYRLVVQQLEHTPEVPRKILRRAWGDEFRSYAIVPDKNSHVVGTIWPTNAAQRTRIKNWELIMEGWFESIDRIYVKAGKSRLLCCTECLPGRRSIRVMFLCSETLHTILKNFLCFWIQKPQQHMRNQCCST